MTKKFKLLFFSFLFLSLFIFSACGTNNENEEYKAGKDLSPEEARVLAEEFINDYLMLDGTMANVVSDGVAYGMYLLKVDIGMGEAVDSFITKDGRLLFPQALDIDEIIGDSDFIIDDTPMEDVNIPTSAKPEVEIFVMTYCPYGTQIQKGILPVLEVLGDNIDFKQKYVDYAMQSKKELDENLLQYCLEKESQEKLVSYLECFLIDGESDACLQNTVSNLNTINSCIEETDKEFKITENFENNVDFRGSFPSFNIHQAEVMNYGISGSPALVINGVQVPAPRDPASLLNIICEAFEEKPEVCQAELSNTPPAPGFGFEGTGSNTIASCG